MIATRHDLKIGESKDRTCANCQKLKEVQITLKDHQHIPCYLCRVDGNNYGPYPALNNITCDKWMEKK